MLDSDPLWYKDAIIYELHVKAFLDSTGDGIGDFAGLMTKLDYLEDLGVTCVWLLPFYPSPQRDDGYDISDYFSVHPAYGRLEDFRRFVAAAHRRNIRVITELVLNHTSDLHPWFQEARKAPPASSRRNFYVWSDTDQKYCDARVIFLDFEKSNWTWDPVAQAYYWHRFYHHQPDLNYDNPRVRQAILRVMRFWLKMGVDGFRLDAVPYLVEREGTTCENLPETHAVLKELRRQLDAEYPDHMLLAEANQWPPDVRPYFGDGDECHMAFHFPLMPRIFMAVSREDRHPITEILHQTPDIPPSCQWALFLRNHDELTLEMVTDEERDYMYHEYAADRLMRLNLGIRRRLASLLDNDRRKIELLNALLFSLPGTPVIYYGDEIGMGDNFYLGDRAGVRTPMQWTPDRNAGFSHADFARLYCPPNMDPVYGYQAVNVEAQQRNPSSLLHWMKRLIALRKQFRSLGRGSISFLAPKNRKVLAFLRRHEDEVVLVVANLSRFAQPAELDLSEFKGDTPIAMFGRVSFPRIGKLPYFLTLAPYAVHGFELVHSPSSIVIRPTGAAPARAAVPLLAISGGWDAFLAGRARTRLEHEILPAFLVRQRWFGAKSRTITSARVIDWAELTPAPSLSLLTIVEVRYADHPPDLYCVPLAVASGADAEGILRDAPGAAAARLRGKQAEGVLYGGLLGDTACAAMFRAIETGRRLPTRYAEIRAFTTAAFSELRGDEDPARQIRRGFGEQSNTSVLYGDRLMLKVCRRLETGRNPDLEVGLFLTGRAGFERVPKTAGAIEYDRGTGEPVTLALLHQFIPNQGTAWEYTVDELARYYETANACAYDVTPEVSGDSLLDLSEKEPPPMVMETMGTAIRAAAVIGRRTAEMHLALASDATDPAFAPEPLTSEDLAVLLAGLREQAASAFMALRQRLKDLSEDVWELGRVVLREGPSLVESFAAIQGETPAATKIRCHGDYHLGQLLRVENDFVIIDFEGEPDRTLAERRSKQSPLRDAAGMIRAFDYAAYAALFAYLKDRSEEFDRLMPWADVWRQWAAAAFLGAYRETAAGATFLPADRGQRLHLLECFMFEKALYELQYELDHRPDWVRIPLAGILRGATVEA
jgi:maltose alpha-D-glucosyltransferase/alpha-amylase